MSQVENNGTLQSLSSGSENGVAPLSDLPGVRNCDWLCHHRHGWQFGEQGVLEALTAEIEKDIPEEHRWVVEFGCGNGADLPLTCDRITRRPGWRGLLIDSEPENVAKLRRRVPATSLVVEGWVKPEPGLTIDEHMAANGCPQTPALMIVDVDSIDYYIVRSMAARPYLLCVEHMDMICPLFNDKPFVPVMEDAGNTFTVPNRGGVFSLQANSQALDLSVPGLGYTLVFRTRINSVYARNDIVNKVTREPDGKVRLNVGAGDHSDRRYTDIDLKTGGDALKLPYDDNSVDEVYSAHLLEHFRGRDQVDAALAEWVRVLKPGGLLRVAVPDMAKLARKVLDVEEEGGFHTLEQMICGAHSDDADKHGAIFTEASLRERMHRAGIGDIQHFHPFITDDCSRYDISLNLDGTKRWWPKVEKPTVALVLSQPRFTFSGHEISLLELARKVDFNIQTCTGSFWDRDMTAATQAAIKAYHPEFLFYSDYDSVMGVDDFKLLIETIQNDPQMAAIGAVQMSRHNDRPLVFEDSRDYSGDTTRVDFSHFGLMVIRREVFEGLPQPWFWSIPGKNAAGEWDWDQWSRTDADITFWRNLKRMGFRVYQHNKVCIGHIVQCVKYPRDTGRGVQLIPIENYWKTGKPKDAVFNQDCYKPKPPAPPEPPKETT